MVDLPNHSRLTVCEVKDFLRISRSKVYELVIEGALKAERYRGSIRVIRDSVIDYCKISRLYDDAELEESEEN